ncbi:MAG: Gfo/Idh/MocA family oxidoreductase [Austwickia sp.]|jgi:predicted dehydrogenase|nr:MAG: Gfo/Idh/MocA family oxidoreductase [Austwickia sp.]
MTQTLSAAVIGAGMAGTTHANAWRQVGTVFDLGLPKVRLATIADAHLPFAQDCAQRYGYATATADWRDIVADDSIDIVSIVVGNALHREMAEALVAAGKHVLCEKPLSDTLADAAAMAELEAATDRVTAIGYTYRRNPALARIKTLADEGALGDLIHFDGRYWCDYGVDPNVPMAWRYKGPMGSGALGDIGSHLVDAAEFVCGPIASVSGAVLTTAITERPVPTAVVAGGRGAGSASAGDSAVREPVENDDVATFTAHFASGAAGTFSVSRVVVGMPNAFMVNVLGTRARVSWDLARGGEIGYDDGAGSADGLGGARQVLVNPTFPYFARGSSMAFGGVGLTQIEQFTYQAYAFLQQVAGVTDGALPPCASFADGYREMRILDAVARSAAAGGAAIAIS